MSLTQAVDRAVVKNMSIYEYDEELHMKTTREEGDEDGYASGKEDGYTSGIETGIATGI